MSATTRVLLTGVLFDPNGSTQTWNPLPQQVTNALANVPEITIAAGAQVQVQTAAQAGQIGYLRNPRTSGSNLLIGGGVTDIGFPLPPGGWFLWPSGTGSNIFVSNPGTTPTTIAVGAF